MKNTLLRSKLTFPALLMAACMQLAAQQSTIPEAPMADANAVTAALPGYCVFESRNANYQGGPPEPIRLVWRKSDGAVASWDWLHGSVPWFSYSADRGTATQDNYYYLLNVGITTSGYTSTRYSLKGYIAENIAWPAATFAVILEGTGTAWFVAHGTLHCD